MRLTFEMAYASQFFFYVNFIKVFDFVSMSAFTTWGPVGIAILLKEESSMLVNTDIFFDFIGRLKLATVVSLIAFFYILK